jgi:hypothetical protein
VLQVRFATTLTCLGARWGLHVAPREDPGLGTPVAFPAAVTDAAELLPTCLLTSRLLNQDGAGLVQERLDQTALLETLDWFRRPTGADGGDLLLRSAPIFEACLERVLRASTAGGPPDPRRHTLAMFGMGITMGAAVLSAREGDSPFSERADMHDVVEMLASEGDAMVRGQDGAFRMTSLAPAVVSNRLIEFEPMLDVVVHAGFRLAMDLSRRPGRRGDVASCMRLLFFLGLRGAGIELPTPPAGRARRIGRRATRRSTDQQPGLFEN